MRKRKLSFSGQAERRQRIVNYLKENGRVTSHELCEAFKMSRSSLSDDIHAINQQAPIIVSPSRGIYELVEEFSVRAKLDRCHIRRWYIMLLLSEHPAEFKEILSALDKAGIPISINTLYSDLKIMKQNQYVTSFSDNGRTLYSSRRLVAADRSDIERYFSSKNTKNAYPRILIDSYNTINEKLAHSFMTDNQNVLDSSSLRLTNRYNLFSKEQLGLLEEFQAFPYKEYYLSIPYKTNTGSVIISHIAIGLIIYSVETNRLYLLGKNDEDLKTIIPLDHVLMNEITVLEEHANHSYQSAEFQRIFDEMFHLSMEAPVKVRVRFENIPSISSKLQRLTETRMLSKTEIINDGREILYTDTLRGLEDFARYLRRFGRSALVDEPPELRERMIATSRKVLSLYNEEP